MEKFSLMKLKKIFSELSNDYKSIHLDKNILIKQYLINQLYMAYY